MLKMRQLGTPLDRNGKRSANCYKKSRTNKSESAKISNDVSSKAEKGMRGPGRAVRHGLGGRFFTAP